MFLAKMALQFRYDVNRWRLWILPFARKELLSKHVIFRPTMPSQLRCLSVAPDNILSWPESQQQTYPTLSKLELVPGLVSTPRICPASMTYATKQTTACSEKY